MKKFLIMYVITVLVMALIMSGPTKYPAKTVSEEEREEYRQTLIESRKKYNYKFSEEELNQEVEDYVARNTHDAYEVRKTSFGDALKMSLFICTLVFGFLFIVFKIRCQHFTELFSRK